MNEPIQLPTKNQIEYDRLMALLDGKDIKYDSIAVQ